MLMIWVHLKCWAVWRELTGCCGVHSGGCWPCRCCNGGCEISHVQLSVFSVLLGSSTSFLAKIGFPYWSEDIKTPLLFIIGNHLPKGRKRLHLPAPGAIWSYLGHTISHKYGCHPPSGWSPLCLSCLQGGHNWSCGRQNCTVLWGWNSF